MPNLLLVQTHMATFVVCHSKLARARGQLEGRDIRMRMSIHIELTGDRAWEGLRFWGDQNTQRPSVVYTAI